MPINAIQPGTYTPQTLNRIERPRTEQPSGGNIGEQISNAIGQVDKLQKNADALTEQVASGQLEDTHKAMIAMEHALLAFDFTLQVRNKVLDAYQEIMRTQV